MTAGWCICKQCQTFHRDLFRPYLVFRFFRKNTNNDANVKKATEAKMTTNFVHGWPSCSRIATNRKVVRIHSIEPSIKIIWKILAITAFRIKSPIGSRRNNITRGIISALKKWAASRSILNKTGSSWINVSMPVFILLPFDLLFCIESPFVVYAMTRIALFITLYYAALASREIIETVQQSPSILLWLCFLRLVGSAVNNS